MDTKELESLLSHHGLSISGYRGGAGKFRDLEIGVGQPLPKLHAFLADYKEKTGGNNTLASMTYVGNNQHPQYGKPYVEIGSFWWE